MASSEREALYYRYLAFDSLVKGGSVQPNWMADGSTFWYAEGAPDNTVIYKVDPRANTKSAIFDIPRLRTAIKRALGHEAPYRGVPFTTFRFSDDRENSVEFTVENSRFLLHLDSYQVAPLPVLSAEEKDRENPRVVDRRPEEAASHYYVETAEVPSPDGKWFASFRDRNIWLRSTYDGRLLPLTDDGAEFYEWYLDGAKWSPDSFKLAVLKVDERPMNKVPIVHWLKTTEEVEWIPFSKAGTPMSCPELFIVDVMSRRQVRVDIGEQPEVYLHIVGWRPDGSELLFLRMSRNLKRLDVMAANPTTGLTRMVLSETQKTFIGGISVTPPWTNRFTWVDNDRFVWASERDGWNHLYLYNLEGGLLQKLTSGTFPVLLVLAVDNKAGWVYFTAHAEQRLYDTHLYRVDLAGQHFSRLTDGSGEHEISLSPSRQFFLDTHSTVDQPPRVELRSADGKLVRTLAEANIDALRELQWRAPEEFVVKAADGKTDLYGVLYKPYDFDPHKKYPLIENIYGGPQTTVTPRKFVSMMFGGGYGNIGAIQAQALAQLGFIVFLVDGRGTTERGKAFQDVVYRNFGRNEILDHVAVIHELAAARPYIDATRVGVFGISFGGYFTTRALLQAPDVYRVGVATAPIADLYEMASAIEPYLDLPENDKEGYDYASNTALAGNLKGKLLVIGGTSDLNATFDSTMKLTEAFIRAQKPFDLFVFPEQPHAISGSSRVYWFETIHRYFQQHLQP
jgi:dipeptidyl aminopeptidase/acylaminoacyl peptidase